MRRYRARASNIEIEPYRMSARRISCATDHVLFLNTYLADWFYAPFSPDQLESLEDIRHLFVEGRDFADGEPRGTGKTARFQGMGMWAVLYGYIRFMPLIAANARMAKKLMKDIQKQFATNDLLAEDFPDICIPIREAWSIPNRAKSICINGEIAELECSILKLVLPAIRCCEDAPDIYSSAFECAGLKEACRGLTHQTATGKKLRPNVALIDDPLTRAAAKSQTQSTEVLGLIRQDIKFMGGFNRKVAIGIACTVIQPGDASDQLLDRKKNPDLHGVRKKFIKQFPLRSRWGMTERKLEYKIDDDLWGKYIEQRRYDKEMGGNGEPANNFYLEHRTLMDEGSAVLWDAAFDAGKGEISALQSGFNFIADNGEGAFFAEMQNQPIKIETVNIKLNTENVISRANGVPMYEVPPDAQHLVVGADINDHCISWAAGAFRRDLGGSIIAYDEWGRNGNCGPEHLGQIHRPDRIWDEKKPAPEGKRMAFWNALNAFASWLFAPGRFTRDARQVPINIVLFDSGYTLDAGDRTIFEWCYAWRSPPMNGYGVMPSRGWSANRFPTRPDPAVVRQSVIAWYRVEVDRFIKEVHTLHFDAGFHRNQMQQAWLLAPNSPGSLMVNGTPSANGMAPQHIRFGQSVASEKLLFYEPAPRAGVSGVYDWQGTPGIRNDIGDCVTSARLAAWTLIGDNTAVSIMGATKQGGQPSAVSDQPSESSAPPSTLPPLHPSTPPRPSRRYTDPSRSGWDTW